MNKLVPTKLWEKLSNFGYLINVLSLAINLVLLTFDKFRSLVTFGARFRNVPVISETIYFPFVGVSTLLWYLSVDKIVQWRQVHHPFFVVSKTSFFFQSPDFQKRSLFSFIARSKPFVKNTNFTAAGVFCTIKERRETSSRIVLYPTLLDFHITQWDSLEWLTTTNCEFLFYSSTKKILNIF